MNQITSRPASSVEISDALRVLFDAGLPFQRGAKADGVAMAYVEALQGMSIEGIQAGIRKFIRGECEDVSPRFVPTPPELARIVRTAVVPSRVPEERRIAPFRHSDSGERARMRLKMPMYDFATKHGRIDELAAANRAGMTAMIALAMSWGVPVPAELFDVPEQAAERQWHTARNRAWAEIEHNPPPFMRGKADEVLRNAA